MGLFRSLFTQGRFYDFVDAFCSGNLEDLALIVFTLRLVVDLWAKHYSLIN